MLLVLPLVAIAATSARNPFPVEAGRLTRQMIVTFYDTGRKIWKPPVASAEGVGRQGYTFWCSLLAWQAIVEAAQVDPKTWRPQIGRYFDVLEQYFDKREHAYCAWRYFPGNDDKFYDDNAWASVACMEAYQVTGEARYRARAIEVFRGFVRGGWDSNARPGGVRWGTKPGFTDRADRTTSATAASALAALLIDGRGDRQWAKRALDWIRAGLSSPTGLIYDGFASPKFERMSTTWTYNTGVPIRAALLYARLSGDRSYRKWALLMGNAALDRGQPLFDLAASDRSTRYWWDSTFFVHYLADGLRELSRVTGNRRYVGEARREAQFVLEQLRDSDGLYWRNMRLWAIDANRLAAFIQLTGQTGQALSPDETERSMEPGELAKPVGDRAMTKTLLANAGAARLFWLLSH